MLLHCVCAVARALYFSTARRYSLVPLTVSHPGGREGWDGGMGGFGFQKPEASADLISQRLKGIQPMETSEVNLLAPIRRNVGRFGRIKDGVTKWPSIQFSMPAFKTCLKSILYEHVTFDSDRHCA